jgi:S-DNA-T family DNA segregation ATPase FtsK/SpoIIIE
VTLGISDDDLAPATVDFTDMHLLVVGSYRSGRSTLLATLASGIRDAAPDAELQLLSPRRNSPLRDLGVWTATATTAAACTATVVDLVGRVEAGDFDLQPAFLFIDDGGELTDAMVVTQLERLVRRARDTALRVVAAVDTTGARGVGLGWVRELRKEGHGVLLQPDLAADGDILSARLPRRVAVELRPGRGFLVTRGTAQLVQVAS